MGGGGHRRLDDQQRRALIEHIGRRMSRMDDERLIRLEEVTREGLTRRGFLRTLIVGIASAACGAGATALVSGLGAGAIGGEPLPSPSPGVTPAPTSAPTRPPTVTPQPTGFPTSTPGMPPEAAARIGELESRVAELSAQRDELLERIDELQASLQDALSQISALQAENSSLRELVALYEQLEATGLDDAIMAGFGPVGLAVLAAAGSRVTVESEVVAARDALDGLESDVPTISNGLSWLEARLNELADSLQTVEDTLSQAVEPARPFADLVGEFIRTVLNLLPFGAGEPIVAGLEAIGALLTNLPDLIRNAGTMVISPLEQWYSGDEPEMVTGVVKPVRDRALGAAERLAQDTASLESAYNEQLVRPVEDILARRRAIREQIEAA